MILRRALASAAVLAALVGTGLGTAVAANASVVNGPTSNGIYAAGFQVSGTTSINEVRSNVTVASNATSDAYLFLESNVNGGDEYVVSLRNEGGEYFLAAADAHGVTNPVTGAPAISGLTFHNIPTVHSADGSLFSAADGGAFTIELHYSTSKHTVVVVAGQSENNVASLDTFTGVHATFTAPAVEGVSTHPFAHNTDLFFNRNGLTEPAGSNVGGVAGTRVTLDFFNLDQTQGVNGPAINLAASALPTTSSDFTVTNNANLTIIAPPKPDTCTHLATTLNGSCATQEDGNNRFIAVNNGTVVAQSNPALNDEEFIWYNDGLPNNNKLALYAPNGVNSHTVLTDVGGHVELTHLGSVPSNDQQWNFNNTGWTNVGTGDVLQSHGENHALTTAPAATTGASVTWTFVGLN